MFMATQQMATAMLHDNISQSPYTSNCLPAKLEDIGVWVWVTGVVMVLLSWVLHPLHYLQLVQVHNLPCFLTSTARRLNFVKDNVF